MAEKRQCPSGFIYAEHEWQKWHHYQARHILREPGGEVRYRLEIYHALHPLLLLRVSPEEVDPLADNFDYERRPSGPRLAVRQTLWLA
jgi:hypothetical protein